MRRAVPPDHHVVIVGDRLVPVETIDAELAARAPTTSHYPLSGRYVPVVSVAAVADSQQSPRPAGSTAHGPRRREPSWDVLRSGFVLLVVLYHSTYLGPELLYPDLISRPFTFPHQVGASLLLVISGYFACATLGRYPAGRYWWGRVARLLPAFLVAVPLAWLALRYLAPPEWWTPGRRDLVWNWLLLGNWDPGMFPFLDGSYWTLPLQLMAFTAAAVLGATRWGSGHRLRIVLWAAVLVPLAQWPLRIAEPPEIYRMIVDGLGFHRLHLFVAGVAVWLWARERIGRAHVVALLAACGVAQFAHTIVLTPEGWDVDRTSVLAICGGVVLVALVARVPHCNRLVPAPVAVVGQWLAGISYGMYLMHQTVGYVVMRRLQDLGAGPGLQSTAMLVTAILAGWAMSRIVERPSHRVLLTIYDRFFMQRNARTG